jgi:hypothetical protein
MSLEAVLEANTLAMRELTAALIAAGAIATAQAPGVDKVVKAQKGADAKKSQGGSSTPKDAVAISAKDAAELNPKSGEPSTPAPATESADAVELKPWHEKTAALFAKLNGKAPELAHVQEAVLGINTHCGREQATALLSRFGAQAISPKPDKKGLDAAQYPEVFALALEVLAGRIDATESMVSE